jgi:large subunit ribosomal protein L10e
LKARNYREVKGVPYTRTKYIHGAPQSKIVKFTMGAPSDNLNVQVSLLAQKRVQIRHNALEAARVAVNRLLEEKLSGNFYLRVLPLPHVVLRENKMIFGAHADRLQDGMKRAFGKPIGRAARVDPDQPVIMVYVNESGVEVAKEAMKRGEAKLPTPCRIIIEKKEKKSPEAENVAS